MVPRKNEGELPVRTNLRRPSRQEEKGPGVLFMLVALAAIALISARFFGFSPQDWMTPAGGGPVDLVLPDHDTGVTVSTNDGPMVLIYHTHARENYAPKDPFAPAGQTGDVVEVGRAFAQALEAHGIRVVHLTGSYDQVWSEAEQRVRTAVQEMLDRYPDIVAVFDIHRDSIEAWRPGIATAQVGGQDAAKVLFVVPEAENERLAENLQFATALRDALQGSYPTLSRGVRQLDVEGIGDLAGNHVRVYIGDYEDTSLAEARTTAQLLAGVVAGVLLAQ